MHKQKPCAREHEQRECVIALESKRPVFMRMLALLRHARA
jgi:hypothetical protein